MAPPTWDTVTELTAYHGPCMPKDLGLKGGAEELRSYDTRVYVLRCQPRYENGPFTWYVGAARKRNLAARLKTEILQSDSAADFCKQNKPVCIEFIWPAASFAVEAYVYYALLERLGAEAAAKGRIGGWTQTQAAPDKFGKLVIERDRRMLVGCCLGCGENHKARSCKKVPDTCPLSCGHCHATLEISSRGFVIAVDAPKQSSLQNGTAANSRTVLAPAAVKRSAPAPKPGLVPSATPPCKRVKVCGQDYTTLHWFCGKQPGPRVREVVLKSCGRNALVLKNGDSKTLDKAGFAGPRGKELLPGRVLLPSNPKDTACCSVRSGVALQIHKPGGAEAGRGHLWLVSDLEGIPSLRKASGCSA